MPINELKLARELIRRPSITPKDAGAINILAKYLRSLGFKCQMMNFKNIKNLYAKLGKSSPNFCYAGHTDVVPVGDLKSWSVNPFAGAVKNNRLVGRGANDMKGSIACFVAAVSKFKSKKFKGSISLLITGDEEGIAINGTKRVVEYLKRKKEKIDFCLVGEPTNQNKLGEMMKIGRRGSITGYLTVCGIQGHVAYPHDANQIENIKLDKGTKNFQPSNLEIVKMNIENTADNVIPAEATATFNIRFNNKHSSSSLKKKLNNIFLKACKKSKCSFKISYMVSGEAFITN
ncbi:MAG TPA: succinyl-diaminopimelate desuccinylase, partial [Candidatus Pelagibacter sp.]|nr:succinyl-diaminopimelate desuccinylase [Candidatus Pelagibacter sp.]